MSAAVRRMIFDIQFKWLLIAAPLALLIPVLDGLWLVRPGRGMPLGAVFFLGLPATSVTAVKLPVWRLLPVSRREIGHAQWWLGAGAPLILIFSGLALALVVVGVAGALRASPSAVLALAGGECAVTVPLSLLPLVSSALRKRLGPWTVALIAFLWIAVFAVTAFSAPVLTPSLAIALPQAGAIAIAAAIAAFVFSPTLPLNEPMRIRKPLRRRAGRLAGSGMTGWAGLWRPFLIYTAALAAISMGLFIGIGVLACMADPIAAAMGMGVLAMAPFIFGAMVRQSARALRSVPMRAVSLTSVLLGAMVAVQLLAFAALYLTCRLCDGPGGKVLALLPLVIGFGACSLGAMLRRRGPMTVVLSWPVFILASDLLYNHPALAQAVTTVGLVALLAGWLSIYFELSRGRSVYQPRAASGLTWRGL